MNILEKLKANDYAVYDHYSDRYKNGVFFSVVDALSVKDRIIQQMTELNGGPLPEVEGITLPETGDKEASSKPLVSINAKKTVKCLHATKSQRCSWQPSSML